MAAPQTARSSWRLLLLVPVGFLLAMLAGFGIYGAFGLCMESEPSACGDSPWREWWHLAIIWSIAMVVAVGPALLALRRGLQARRAGDTGATPLIVVSGVLAAFLSVVFTLSMFV